MWSRARLPFALGAPACTHCVVCTCSEVAILKAQLQAHEKSAHTHTSAWRSQGDKSAALEAEVVRMRDALRECQSDLQYLQEAGDAEIVRQVQAAEARLQLKSAPHSDVEAVVRERDVLALDVQKLQASNTELMVRPPSLARVLSFVVLRVGVCARATCVVVRRSRFQCARDVVFECVLVSVCVSACV